MGPIPGLLLFLIHIIDLPNCLTDSRACMFSNDNNWTYASNNLMNVLAMSLNIVISK